ncbi:MAG: hypothetical protein LBQ14_00445 [Treponema sp.]|jgi:hypothetical protein|nr:hypothetical protein [Treponema sp.]
MIRPNKLSRLRVLVFGACCFVCACSSEAELQRILGVSAQAPVFLGCKALSPTEIVFQFNTSVKAVSVYFDPPLDIASVENGSTVRVALNKAAGDGEKITTDLLVEDGRKNTLNVLVPFRTRNNRLPAFLLTEVRAEHASPKLEFTEIKTLTPGNLGALRLFAAIAGLAEPLFEFPPVEVEAGTYIVIHLRTLGEGNVDETGNDLNASRGEESIPGVRDFWIPLSAERLRSTDAVFFMDQDDQVIDAVMFSETPGTSWTKKELLQAAKLLGGQGAWLAGTPEAVPDSGDAVDSSATTPTRTICRDEDSADTNSAADWYIAKGSTPGERNNTNRYVPKQR